MAEERHRVLDHALVEHRHEGLVVAGHQTARHDREIGCLVGIQIQIDRISGLGHGSPLTPMDGDSIGSVDISINSTSRSH